MHKDDVYKLGMFVATKQRQPWIRGINDCCTLGMEWHDTRFGTETLKQIYGKYNNLKSAIRVAKKINLSQWFIDNGYTQIHDEKVIDGDIVMVMNQAWGIQDDAKGLSRHQLDTMLEHTIWRI